jgi:hypothetical protein
MECNKKASVFSTIFYAILAVDLSQRYYSFNHHQISGFYVAHFDFIPTTRDPFVVVLLATIFSITRSMGCIKSLSSGSVFILSGYYYFSNIADCYQHHYLVWLICGLIFASDTFSLGGLWTIDAISWQMCIVYAFALVTKCTREYMSGELLSIQAMKENIHDIVLQSSRVIGTDASNVWCLMATSAFIVEIFLLFGIIFCRWYQRTSALVWIIGIAFHSSIPYFGFKIGYFSWYMVSFYMIFSPEIFTEIFFSFA